MTSSMTSTAIYARVSSARQKKDETIASQTAALRAHAEQLGLDVPDDWVFEDEGHSGATLVRPALERLRDLVASIGIDVVLCYSPDRLARKFAYQALFVAAFTRAGTRVEFIKGPRGDTPEDQLLVQFQGMFAEYEKAQIMERYRRGKTHRAQTGSINVLGGAPFGYRYVAKSAHVGAAYEIIEHEAALVAELFGRYADDGASIAELARWLTDARVPTRTGKHRWDRSVVWGMLRNPAYAGRAVFGKTMVVHESPGLNRVARLQGRSTPRASKTVDRPREQAIEIPVPAIVSEETFARAAQRLADNKRFASRNSKVPSLLQGLAACSSCGYGYYRTSTRTTNKKIYYYRCLGSDDYRYETGRVCGNKPVRADYLDTVVWNHITGLLADPGLIRAEIDRRLDTARHSDPAVRERQQLQTALAPELAATAGVGERGVESGDGVAERHPCAGDAGGGEHPGGVGEGVRLGQPVVVGDPDALERDLGLPDRPQRGFALDATGLVAGCPLLDEEPLHPAVGGVAGPHDDDVGDGALADPLLVAVEDPGVAVATSGGLQGNRVE